MSAVLLAGVFDSEDLCEDLAELGTLLVDLPPDSRSRAALIYARVLDSNRRRRKLLALVRDSISDMRLDIKYLQFDLEATCRERDELRKLLDDEEGDGWSTSEMEDEVDDL